MIKFINIKLLPPVTQHNWIVSCWYRC